MKFKHYDRSTIQVQENEFMKVEQLTDVQAGDIVIFPFRGNGNHGFIETTELHSEGKGLPLTMQVIKHSNSYHVKTTLGIIAFDLLYKLIK